MKLTLNLKRRKLTITEDRNSEKFIIKSAEHILNKISSIFELKFTHNIPYGFSDYISIISKDNGIYVYNILIDPSTISKALADTVDSETLELYIDYLNETNQLVFISHDGVNGYNGKYGDYLVDNDTGSKYVISYLDFDILGEAIQNGITSEFNKALEKASINFIHELTHSFDDFVSNNKAIINDYTSISTDGVESVDVNKYTNNTAEINASYTETISKIYEYIVYDFEKYLEKFADEFENWDLLNKDNKRRLVSRLYTEWELSRDEFTKSTSK